VNESTTIGLDLAKNVFHYVGCDRGGREISKKQLKRKALLSHFANLPSCLVGMEACAGAISGDGSCRPWGTRYGCCRRSTSRRTCAATERLQRRAGDRRGGEPAGVAAGGPQDGGAAGRAGAASAAVGAGGARTALGNQLRGLLAEYGIVIRRVWRRCAGRCRRSWKTPPTG